MCKLDHLKVQLEDYGSHKMKKNIRNWCKLLEKRQRDSRWKPDKRRKWLAVSSWCQTWESLCWWVSRANEYLPTFVSLSNEDICHHIWALQVILPSLQASLHSALWVQSNSKIFLNNSQFKIIIQSFFL